MNENSRYIIIIVGAIVLMSVGLWVAYEWEQREHVNKNSATLQLQQMFEHTEKHQDKRLVTDTITEEGKLSRSDSIMKQRKEEEVARRSLQRIAEREGYMWQQTLLQYRFREPAEACLNQMQEHGAHVRDSLSGEYASIVSCDSILSCYDIELEKWQTRLVEQVQLLPTAKQALAAEQISQEEYRRIISSITK